MDHEVHVADEHVVEEIRHEFDQSDNEKGLDKGPVAFPFHNEHMPPFYNYQPRIRHDQIKQFGKLSLICAIILCTAIYLGNIVFFVLLELAKFQCFRELNSLSHSCFKKPFYSKLKLLVIDMGLFFVVEYFVVGMVFKKLYEVTLDPEDPESFWSGTETILFFLERHATISFTLVCMYLIYFVTTLEIKKIRHQFSHWTHLIMIVLVLQGLSFHQFNLLQGSYWLIMPLCLLLVNDIAAHFWCLLLGKIRWGKVPTRSLEGFIGGLLTTFMSSFVISGGLSWLRYFSCRWEWMDLVLIRWYQGNRCDVIPVFFTETLRLPLFIQDFFSLIGVNAIQTRLHPIQLHSMPISILVVLCALVGRVLIHAIRNSQKIKQFGNLVAPFGGLMDVIVPVLLMGPFITYYFVNFIEPTTSTKQLADMVLSFPFEEQLHFVQQLQQHLKTFDIEL